MGGYGRPKRVVQSPESYDDRPSASATFCARSAGLNGLARTGQRRLEPAGSTAEGWRVAAITSARRFGEELRHSGIERLWRLHGEGVGDAVKRHPLRKRQTLGQGYVTLDWLITGKKPKHRKRDA